MLVFFSMIGRNDDCWCGSGKKWKKCHWPDPGHSGIILKTPEQIAGIRRACSLTASILNTLIAAAKPGVTTETLDQLSRLVWGGALQDE